MLAASLRRRVGADSLRCIHARSSDPRWMNLLSPPSISDAAGGNLQTLTPSSEQFWQNLSRICRIQDEPFGSPSVCMQYFVMQQARASGCTVMLDGQGADEVLLGYSKYMVLALSHAWQIRWPYAFTAHLGRSWSANASLTPHTTLQYLVATLVSHCVLLRVRSRLSFLQLPIDPVRNLYGAVSAVATDCRRTQLLELFQTSLPALLRYEDRNSMAHSVARLPFFLTIAWLRQHWLYRLITKSTSAGANILYVLQESCQMQLLGVVQSLALMHQSVLGLVAIRATCWNKRLILH